MVEEMDGKEKEDNREGQKVKGWRWLFRRRR